MNERDEMRQQLEGFFAANDPALVGNDLAEALYAISEHGIWPDNVTVVSVAQTLLCWRIVEKLRTVTFPDELRT